MGQAEHVPAHPGRGNFFTKMAELARNPAVVFGGIILLLVVLIAIFAPLLTGIDPNHLQPRLRLKPPSERAWFGTDQFGRDVYSRALWGARVSFSVGFCAAVIGLSIGLLIGLASGFLRRLDAVLMRVMDGIMAIPSILLAISLIALTGTSIWTVIIAVTVPEIPRVARLVRGMVLSIREEAYIEAAIGVGTPTWVILFRHVLPNTIAPLLVQGTFICASAILLEALLSFLGVGIPTEVPSWGNIMSEGRQSFQLAPWVILFPGAFVSLTVLAINLLGDGLRDTLDPRLTQKSAGAK